MNTIYDKWNDMEIESTKDGKSLYNRIEDSPFLIGWDPVFNVPFMQIEIQTDWTPKELKSYTTKGMVTHKNGRLLELKLKQVKQDGQFMKLCVDIIAKYREGATPDNATRTVLSDSANFFKSNKSGLGKNEQMGLYGELCLLEKLLNHFPEDHIKVVNGWKGPTRTYHDFQYKNKSIEVKSTRKKTRSYNW